ncbi:bacitracin resistence protein [Pyrobaculum aerophilum str. IM2]|uniref:Undecaprenyl-diphosphatase n=1 Tax=Pyrobaculum aerophilum (strain ATCC 51768 / DSM 7523 / JCM 9630 / CIP 104966 / NBRC 100827 / IM2) TaxID=178306 RepID=UPPP_PYRAE|nr:undecaprenyl-diphosphate phosphatase [Pyrobaculum aerophilum]Q8ZYX0.1 RecName: Full=Undecaprenyl-diphosphatase; AltName: Full=Undecaprenyl pyrophosphate phosphatase [Pyrobaculum aerophilum str. IM2]AAL62872.1 bacitracin resistence protein [Pyrobaculum aerophilum str. IM2]
MDLGVAAILGVVQGISEWLPISSKTQIMLVSIWLLNASPEYAYSLGLFLEAASVLAALIYFRGVYLKALRGFVGDAEGRRWLVYILVTTLVTAVVGLPLYYVARKWLVVGHSAGFLMIVLGLAVVLNAVFLQRARFSAGLKAFDNMSLRDMAIVGIAQAVSVLPGLSRSGATVTALLLLGYKPEEAFRASFVLVPVAGLGATALAYLSEGGAVATAEALLAMAIGIVISIITIKALLEFAKSKHVVLVNVVIGLLAIAGGLLRIIF